MSMTNTKNPPIEAWSGWPRLKTPSMPKEWADRLKDREALVEPRELRTKSG